MRDKRADYSYFDREIVGLVDAINEIRADITSRTTPDAVADFLDWDEHLTFSLNQFSAMYSRGYDVEQLRQVLNTAIEAGDRATYAATYFDREAHRSRTALAEYRTFLWLISLAVAMGVSDEQFAAAKRATAPVHGDRLIDSLISSRDFTHPVGNVLRFPKIVGSLTEAFTTVDPYGAVSWYLSSWEETWRQDAMLFPSNDGSGSPDAGYFGYWAFEVLAVMAILRLDGSPMHAFQAFPIDLAPHAVIEEPAFKWSPTQGWVPTTALPGKASQPGEAEPSVEATQPAEATDSTSSQHQLTVFPINWEVSEVIDSIEELLRDRGLPGTFSEIEEEAFDYEEMDRRDDGLEGHLVTIARLNYALRPHGWSLVPVYQGGDEHAVGAMPHHEVPGFQAEMTAQGFTPDDVSAVKWEEGDTFTR